MTVIPLLVSCLYQLDYACTLICSICNRIQVSLICKLQVVIDYANMDTVDLCSNTSQRSDKAIRFI